MTANDLCAIDTDKMAGAIGVTTVGSSGALVVGANLKRRTLRLFASGPSGVWVNTQQMTATGNGILIVQAGAGLTLTVEDDGELVKRAWYGIGSNPTDAVCFSQVNDGT